MFFKRPIEEVYLAPKIQAKLKKIGIKTLKDLLFYFPYRYEDFSKLSSISQLKLNQTHSLRVKILEIKTKRTFRKKMFLTEALVNDETGTIKVIWFNQPYLTKVLKVGDFVCLAGKVFLGQGGAYLSNPVYEKITTEKLIHTNRFVPVYPETERISSRWLRSILEKLLKKIKNQIKEFLPLEIIKKYQLLLLPEALQEIHFPSSLDRAEKAKFRFSFEELFLLELIVLRERLKLNQEKAPFIPLNLELIRKFVKSLPFSLTNAQKKVSWQILKDLEKPMPCSRLLQGDVGSGKTVVAIIAALNTIKAGWQVAFMSPTEILAKQHFKEVSNLLTPFKIRIGFLTSKEDKIISQKLSFYEKSGKIKPEVLEISRSKLLAKVRAGEIDILIGTHSLIQEKVKFKKLGLCIVDEQHRFGVEQRAKLCQQSTISNQEPTIKIPHLLSLTATPIPRTLALTVYGSLDLSLIDEMPKGRKKIITQIIKPQERQKTYDFIRERIKVGEQAFVICPRIEKPEDKKEENKISSWSEVKAVKAEYQKLSQEIFPDLRIGMLHGKLKVKEKEKIMNDFKNKKIDILVSTSVIEVGIDIPNATIMMIEGAERFGLAQLHQFRGRVGRSDLQSFCFFFTDSSAKNVQARLKALLESHSGFQLAQKDLEIRGPGSFVGLKQWGLPDLAMEGLKDISLIEKTRNAAIQLLSKDPNLNNYPDLKKRLKEFKMKIHLE